MKKQEFLLVLLFGIVCSQNQNPPQSWRNGIAQTMQNQNPQIPINQPGNPNQVNNTNNMNNMNNNINNNNNVNNNNNQQQVPGGTNVPVNNNQTNVPINNNQTISTNQTSTDGNSTNSANGLKSAVIMELPKTVNIRSGTFLGSNSLLTCNYNLIHFIIPFIFLFFLPF